MKLIKSYIEPVNHIGHNVWTFNVWVGPGVTNRTLTQSERHESMFMDMKGNEPGLVGFWPLDSIFKETGVYKTSDLSPSKNHGILVSDPILKKSSD